MGHCAGVSVGSIRTGGTGPSRAALQGMDEGWPRDGLDQYQDHPGDSVLRTHHSHGSDHAVVWVGFNASSTEPRCRKLSSRAAGKATHPHDQAILSKWRVVWASF